MSNLYKGLTLEEWVELREYILDSLNTHGHEGVTGFEIAIAMDEFSDNGFDLVAMHRFLVWAKDNEEDDDMIISTIMHDLNGRNDKCFSPRTGGY